MLAYYQLGAAPETCDPKTAFFDPATQACVKFDAAAAVDCGPDAVRVSLIDAQGRTTGTSCGTSTQPCPAGFTFNANEQACHAVAVPIYKKPLFWVVLVGVVAAGGGAIAFVRYRRKRA
jgi:hypothetical protein